MSGVEPADDHGAIGVTRHSARRIGAITLLLAAGCIVVGATQGPRASAASSAETGSSTSAASAVPSGVLPNTPPPPSFPVVLPSPLPCPGPAHGPVCATQQDENGSTNPPPPLPPSIGGPGSCTSAPAVGAPNAWTPYGSAQTVDYRQFAPAPSYATDATNIAPANELDNEFPLPFIPVVDPAHPCRAYRLSPDRSRIQRSLDSGASWSTVLDGSTTSPRLQMRRIYIGGQSTSHPVVYVSETGNGDGLLRSSDGGSTWQLADGWTSAGVSPVNLVDAFVFSVTTSDEDPNLLYVIEAECHDNRPHPTTSCQNSNGYTTSDEMPAGSGSYIGGVRLYVSRDGGNTWVRFADTAVDSTNGIPDNCDMDDIWMASDPYSEIDRQTGVVYDHIWLDYQASTPCVATHNQVEGTYNGSTPDGTASYQLDATTGGSPRRLSTVPGPGPFAVTHGPGGRLRLVSGNAGTGTFKYSDDDGATWNAIIVNDEDISSVIADPSGTVFAFSRVVFGASEQGTTDEPRPYLMVPGPGGFEVHLGATFPPGLSDFASHGSQWAAADRYERDLFNWPGYDPLVPPLSARETAASLYPVSQQRDDNGAYYVAVGTLCDSSGCGWDGKVPDSYSRTSGRYGTSTWARWQIMRYRPPTSVRSLVALTNAWSPQFGAYNGQPQPSSQASCANAGRCDLVPIAQCTIGGDGNDQNGSVAFDGKELLYSVSGELGPRPYTAVLHRIDPSGCQGSGATSVNDAGTITVQFAPQEYDLARSLTWLDYGWQGFLSEPAVDAKKPSIDTLAYDATHDRLYFTLASYPVPNSTGQGQSGVRQENQLSLWSADLHSAAGFPAATVTAHLVTVNTGYCPDGGGIPGSGSETLAFDRVDGSLWACLPGRPAKLDASGRQIDEPCYETPDIQGFDLSGFHVFSWSMQDLQPGSHSNRGLLLEDTNSGDPRLVQFDLRTCQEGRDYQLVDSAKFRPSHGSMSLACDPVTFGTGSLTPNVTAQAALAAKYAGVAFTGTPVGAVMWSKAGNQLTALLLPDNGDNGAVQDAQTCRLPVDLSISAPASVALGATASVCATLTVQGPGAPIGGQPITATVDGVDATLHLHNRGLTADGSGQVCLNNQALAAGQHTVAFSYQPSALNLAYAAAKASTVVVVGLAAVTPTVQQVPLKALKSDEPPPYIAPFLAPIPANATAKAGAPAVQGQVQSYAQAQGQPAAAEEREEEKQLAFAYEVPEGDAQQQSADAIKPPSDAPDAYPMTALGTHNGGDALTNSSFVNPATVLGVVALAVALRWSCARRRQPVRQRSMRRTW